MLRSHLKLEKAIGLFLAIGLVLSACAPAAAPAPTVSPATPGPKAAVPTAPPAKPAPAVEQPRYGGILTQAKKGEPPHFDMHQATESPVLDVNSPVYNLLVTFDPQDVTKIVPDLAERWEISPDGKLYTFPLHRGVKWHDGRPLTSADVKASFSRMAWPPKGILSPSKELFGPLEEIATPDDYTVVFKLKKPQASFLGILAMATNPIFPKHILDAKGDMKKDLVGTGPFKLKDYTRGVSYEVQKNPDYFKKGLPYLDGFKMFYIGDDQAAFAALRTGQVLKLSYSDYRATPAQQEKLKQENPDLIIKVSTSINFNYMELNAKRKPWDNPKVRKAVWLAADRQGFIRVVNQEMGELGGYNMPGYWGIPREELLKMPGYRQPKDQDLAEARKLLAEAGYPEGKGIEAKVLASALSKNTEDTAIFAADQLRRLGIKATLEVVESGAYKQRLFNHDFDVSGYGYGSSLEDPDVIFGEYYVTGGGKNHGEYSNPKVDELYQKQSQTMDPAERKRLARQMENLAIADAPRVIFAWTQYVPMWHSRVKAFVPWYVKSRYSYEDVWLAR